MTGDSSEMERECEGDSHRHDPANPPTHDALTKLSQLGPCKCINAIRAELKKIHGNSVDLVLRPMINTETLQVCVALPPLQYSYITSGKKRKRSYVTFNYCPFCGRKAQ